MEETNQSEPSSTLNEVNEEVPFTETQKIAAAILREFISNTFVWSSHSAGREFWEDVNAHLLRIVCDDHNTVFAERAERTRAIHRPSTLFTPTSFDVENVQRKYFFVKEEMLTNVFPYDARKRRTASDLFFFSNTIQINSLLKLTDVGCLFSNYTSLQDYVRNSLWNIKTWIMCERVHQMNIAEEEPVESEHVSVEESSAAESTPVPEPSSSSPSKPSRKITYIKKG